MELSSWPSLHYVPAAQRENRGLYVTVQELPWADLGPKDADCGLKATWREGKIQLCDICAEPRPRRHPHSTSSSGRFYGEKCAPDELRDP